MASADLFAPHAMTPTAESFRGVVHTASADFHKVVEIMTVKKSGDTAIIADGRGDMARNQIREWIKSAVGDEFTELWVVYDMEGSLHTDVRNPKRRLAWSSANVETLFLLLPKSPSQRKVVARDHYTKSGEFTNFSRSYTGVEFLSGTWPRSRA